MSFEVTYLPKEAAIPQVPTQESTAQAALRNVTRLGSRAAESAIGLPGDVANSAVSLFNLAVTPETRIQKRLPIGSEDVRQVTKKLGGQYLEPQGKTEQFLDSVVSDFIPLLSPVKGKIPFGKALVTSGLGNFAGWASKEIGGSEATQTGAKLGTMFLSSLGAGPKLKNYMNDLYTKAGESIPEKSFVSAKSLEPKLDKYIKIANGGISTPTKENLRSITKQIKSKIHNGKIDLNQAWQIKKDLNELGYSKSNAKGVEKLIPDLVHDFNSTLQEGGKRYPDFIKNMRAADDIYRSLNQSSALKTALNKYINKEKFISPLTGVALGLYPMKTLGSIAGLYGIREIQNFVEPLFRSKEVGKFYAKIATEAAKNNAPAVIRNVKKFDTYLSKKLPEEQMGNFELTKI